MRMTAGEIIAEARSSWIEPSATFITDAEALRWVNLAQAQFVRATKALRYYYSLSTVALQQEYPLPLDQELMDILWCTCEGEPMDPVTREELVAYDSGWSYAAGGSTGQPSWYYITGLHQQEIGFYYCPDAVYNIVLYGTEAPPAIADVNSYPKIRDMFHDILIPYVEWKGHRKNRDWKSAQSCITEFNTQCVEARKQVDSKQPEKTRILSGPEYASRRHIGRPKWPSNYGVEY